MNNFKKLFYFLPSIILSCQNFNTTALIENKNTSGISFNEFESKRNNEFLYQIKSKKKISKIDNISINVNQLSNENNFSILSNSYLRKKNYLNNI